MHGGAFQPAAHLGWVELVLAPCYWKRCHCSGYQKKKEKKYLQKTFLSPCTQPVSATKRRRQKVSFQQWSFLLLEAEKLNFQDFLSIPLVLRSCACNSITAQQLWLIVRWRRSERGKRNGGGEAVGPALPAPGPALAGNCNSSSGGKISSVWLPLTSDGRGSPYPCLPP